MILDLYVSAHLTQLGNLLKLGIRQVFKAIFKVREQLSPSFVDLSGMETFYEIDDSYRRDEERTNGSSHKC